MELHLVVVEDDQLIGRSVASHLREQLGAVVDVFAGLGGASDALAAADLVILDLQLAASDGMETVRRVRITAPAAFLIVITARGAISDRVEGLRVGADDYLVKPFSLMELEARVEALLRRRAGMSPPSASDLVWERSSRQVLKRDTTLSLTPLEYAVFATLAERPEQALSRVELLRDVIGPNVYGYERVIDVHVGHLRKKLDPEDPYRYIATVRHYGYRWDAAPPVEMRDAR